MSDEKHWTDRVVEELMQSYGVARFRREVSVVVDGVDIGVEGYKLGLKKELRNFSAHPECIRWALDNLPQRVPSPAELRELAKCAPRNQPVAIEDKTPADPDKARAVAEKAAALAGRAKDYVAWIDTRLAGGLVPSTCADRMAREAKAERAA